VAIPPIELGTRPELVDKADDQSITHQQNEFIHRGFVKCRCGRRRSRSGQVQARLMIM